MMDFTALFTEHMVLVVVLACLCLGYAIKHLSLCAKIPNNDIPVILMVIGGALNLFVSGFSIESAVYGGFMGLASTGLHQIFKKFVENNSDAE